MRSLMLALGACLVALNFAGCSSTGSCGCSSTCNSMLGDSSCSGTLSGCSVDVPAADCGCGQSACSGGCGNRFGGQSGLGLSLMEAGPACKSASCNGGCNTCQRARIQLQRPHLAARLASRVKRRSCGCGKTDCGCESAAPTPAPAPAMDSQDCGCGSAGPVKASIGDCGCAAAPVEAPADNCGCGSSECDGGCGADVQTVSHEDRTGLLGKLGFGSRASKVRSVRGCGAAGCGKGGKLCGRCSSGGVGSRIGSGVGHRGCGVNGCGGSGGLCSGCLGRGSIPHRQPSMVGPGAGQVPTYAYPYYTTRAPRDFLNPNPPTIGY